MSSVRVSVEDQDIDFSDIAEQVVADCEEEEFLSELARQSDAIATESTHPTEKSFATEAATRLRELAKWFRENQS